jgi:hypothetical protein
MIETVDPASMSVLERAMAAELLGLEISPVTIVQKPKVINFAEACAELRRKRPASFPLRQDEELPKC